MRHLYNELNNAIADAIAAITACSTDCTGTAAAADKCAICILSRVNFNPNFVFPGALDCF